MFSNQANLKQKPKAKAEAPQEPDSSEEWEKRQYLVSQRRVEALRFLSVLLRNISGRLLPNCSSSLGSTQFNPQEVDIIGTKANASRGNTLKTLEEEELNTLHLQNQEEISKYQVAKSDNKQKQKMEKITRDHLQKSSHCLGEENLRYSPRKQRTGILLGDEEYEYGLFFEHNSLEITIIKGQSLENEDHHGSSESCSKLSGGGQGRKPKIHETDAFFDYLFNYYEAPQYTRICLETSQVAGTCQWQRDVQTKGDGFQISLRKRRHHSINSSQGENLERKEQVQENDYSSNVCTQDPEHKRGKVDYAKECTNGFKTHCQETAHKAGGQLSPTDGNSCLLEKTHTYIEDSKSTRKSQVSTPHESIGLDLQLTDFLEEISSDSECFSETLSINKEEKEKSVATFNSFSEKEPLDTDKMITRKQNTRLSQQTFFSKWRSDGEEKYSNYRFRTPGRKSEYEPKWICSWRRGESHFITHENNNDQMKEQIAPKYLFDEDYYQEPSSSYLEGRFSDSALDQKVKYGPSQVPVTSSRRARSFYFGNFHRRRGTPWKSEYNQNSRRFRGCNFNYFKFNSDCHYSRQNGQEYIDYGSYSGNNCTGSLNFKCFDGHLDQEYLFSQ
ncbi:A-kinase anchor protein 17B-like [Macaca nemestrina]|uniref:A-kinase anchor protein 17B-like n=1 Tax=Macaca nemestrina TaxID=9545 RepID=UPI0039B90825